MIHIARWLATASAVAIAGLLLATPSAEAHHGFGRFGFGFGYPVFYGAPAYYYAPRVAYIPPPLVYHYGYDYGYGYRYRRVVHHYYHRVAHRRWCSCGCCR